MRDLLESADPLAAGATAAAYWAAGLCLVRLVWLHSRTRIRIRRRPRPRPKALMRLLTLVGGGLTLAPAAGAIELPKVRNVTEERDRGAIVGPSRASTWAPPWFGSNGFPPPRPFEWTGGEPFPRHPHTGSREGAAEDAPTERRTYTVAPGDTLWDIAAGSLGTDDPARISRHWPAIHNSNRRTIGPNPDLILPGLVLELPPEVRS